MNITKHEHACLVVEEQGKKLVIDPGEYTTSLTDLTNIVGVVVTHVHADHFKPETLQAIAQQNPEVRIFSTAEVAKELPELPITAVTGGTAETIDNFSLGFFGEHHAFVHGEQPQNQNIGVLVNNRLYYPGDSFTLPEVPVELLAVPVAGPWVKLAEAMDFVANIKPTQCFGTHDAPLSEIGHAQVNAWMERITHEINSSFTYLQPGESLTL